MHEKHVFVGRGTLRRAVQSTLEDSGGRKRTYALIPDERGGVPPIFGQTRFENTPETLRFPACKRHSCVASGRNPLGSKSLTGHRQRTFAEVPAVRCQRVCGSSSRQLSGASQSIRKVPYMECQFQVWSLAVCPKLSLEARDLNDFLSFHKNTCTLRVGFWFETKD